ncbi:MAG TPA: efflux RND transporter periplasmic adaptor subunit [Burkholderiales bacterium]|jgi:RND family efflux transporter MFP subunit|nr:efflux RND transporter periplasmic adaptor subunit [Burkholderiales bacterium]
MAAQRRDSFFVFYIIAFVAVAVAAGAVWYYWSSKQSHLAQDAKTRAGELDAGPTVVAASSARGPGVRRITLVGEAAPYKSTTLYSKVGGYLTSITVDTGDRVRAGQTVAEVETPELEVEYRTAVSSLENKQRILKRTQELAAKGFFSQQALDNAETDVSNELGRVNELRTRMGYRTMRAPFSGVVTARYVDPGALVTNAANNQTSSQPVVTISDTSRLRVTAYVEQVDAPFVKPGTEVEIVDAANPQRRNKGKVSRTGGELDPRTRTLLVEVDFDNARGDFIAGSYVNMTLLIPATSYVEVPAAALVVRDKKNYVAVIGADNHIKLTPVEIAGTDGRVIRILSGLAENTRVALNLPNTISDGAKVNPANPPGTPAPGPAPAAPGAPPPAAGSPQR